MAQKVANASMTIDIPNDKLIIKDETNYAGQGNTQDGTYYGYILSFKSPQGYTIYSNAGGGGDPKDFDYSVPTDSKSFTIPKLSNGEIETGEYILEMIIYGGGDTFEVTKSFNFDGDYEKPDPSITFTVDCITPKFKAVDSTNYAQPKLNYITPVVAQSPTTLTLSSPKSGVADIVENSSVLETSSFYTTVNTVSLVRTIYYEIDASELLYLTDEIEYEEEKNVVCVQDLCSMYAIVEAINKDYTNALSTNHTYAKQELWTKWLRAVGLLIMVRQALSCGNEDALAAYSEEIEDFRDECETEQDNIEPVLVQAWSATDNNTITIAYASDDEGSDFSFTQSEDLPYIGIIAHNRNYTPVQADYDGTWKTTLMTAEVIKVLYESNSNTNAFTDADVDALAGKVDKVSGKGLSTEDYSTTEKTRLSNAIIQDRGIHLDSEKRAVQLSVGTDLDTILDTDIYRGTGLINEPGRTGENGAHAWNFYIVIRHTNTNVVQIAYSFNSSYTAYRTITGGGAGDWVYTLTEADKEDLIDRINKLSVGDIDLSDPAIWYPATKTLDLSTKVGVGIINFNTDTSPIQIASISSSSPAVITVSNASLLQNDKEISLSDIQGGTEYTDLNGNNYAIKNVDYVNNTFELYETDGTTPVDTISTGVITNITDLTVGAPTSIEVAGIAGLDEEDLVEISGTGTLLDGNIYNIFNVNAGANTFDINEDTTGETWSSSGQVTQVTYTEETGEVSFEGGVVSIDIEKITGLDNGTQMKFSVSDNNEIRFNPTSYASATGGDIVSQYTLSNLTINNSSQPSILKNLVYKDLNYISVESAPN